MARGVGRERGWRCWGLSWHSTLLYTYCIHTTTPTPVRFTETHTHSETHTSPYRKKSILLLLELSQYQGSRAVDVFA